MGDDTKAAKRAGHEWAREVREQRYHGSLGSLAAVLADLCRLIDREVIRAHPDLAPYEGMTAVWCRMGSTRGGKPLGPRTLAAKAGRAPSSVSRQLHKLESVGALAVVERRGRALPSVLILCREGMPLGGRAAPPTRRPTPAPTAESVRVVHVGPSPKTSEGVTCRTLTGGSVKVTCRTLTGGSVSSTYGTNPLPEQSGGVARAQARAPASVRTREASTTNTNDGGQARAPTETDAADRFTRRWRETFAEHRQGQAPTTRSGMGEAIGWLVGEAERLGVTFDELLDAKLAAYWSEDWPTRHRSNPTPLNFHAQLPRLAGPPSTEERLLAELRALRDREVLLRSCPDTDRAELDRIGVEIEQAKAAVRAARERSAA